MIKTNKNSYYLAFVAIIIVVFLSSMLYMLLNYEKKIESSMFKIATSDLFEITKHKANFIKHLLQDSDDYIDTIKTDKALRDRLEKNLNNLITENIKYAYILYKDKKNLFRFLVDGSPESEKSMLNQKFDVTNEQWFEIYKTKEPIIIKHDILQKLSISYLVPILNKEELELILVIDFSISKLKEMNQIISIMKNGLIFLLAFIFIVFIIILIQFFRLKTITDSSYVDSLTKLHNRNYLHEIENKISLKEYIIALVDIDFFKAVNDNYGHDVGDEVLKKFGAILLSTIRVNEDIVIRYGGEEFIVLIKRKAGENKIPFKVIERIFNNVREYDLHIGKENYINITVSIGINKSPEKSKTFTEAFKFADLALYEAKNSGRDTIKIYQHK